MGNKPDGYSLGKDAWGDEYFQQGDKIVNENNQETYESKRNRAIASYNAAQQAQQQAAANEAARKANRQAESEMIRDAIKKAGGLPFGIGGTYGNSRTR
ncbi:MAG: hypothetical protein J6P39_03855, partial [Oscillospiraceae bacterium]|nr:hypothetical protein [Oscillospiraceae bacterium]